MKGKNNTSFMKNRILSLFIAITLAFSCTMSVNADTVSNNHVAVTDMAKTDVTEITNDTDKSVVEEAYEKLVEGNEINVITTTQQPLNKNESVR